MSANPVARPQSRRSILTAALAGTAAGAATMAGHVALAEVAPFEPAEAIFREWVAAIALLDGDPDRDHETNEALGAALGRIEDRMKVMEPSPMAAAVLALVELKYEVGDDGPDAPPASTASLVRSEHQDIRFAFQVLRCLRPNLTGRVAAIVTDIFDNTFGSWADSLLVRATKGRASL